MSASSGASRPEGGQARRWLVTCAGGQLGRSMLELASRRGVEAVGRSRTELDITDADAVSRTIEQVEPDVVLNCAAFTQVDLAEESREQAMRINGEGPRILARACQGHVLLVQLSTEYVFSGETQRPIAEEAKAAPQSVYGESKLAGEDAVRDEDGAHLIVRTQWVFGPGPGFVRTILGVAVRGEPLRVVEDQVGRPTWSADLANGILQAVEGGARGTLHLASEGVASWYDLALAAVGEGARRGLNPWVQVQPVSTSAMPRPAQRPAYAVLGLERARELGIKMPHWRDALHAYLQAEAEGRNA